MREHPSIYASSILEQKATFKILTQTRAHMYACRPDILVRVSLEFSNSSDSALKELYYQVSVHLRTDYGPWSVISWVSSSLCCFHSLYTVAMHCIFDTSLWRYTKQEFTLNSVS